MDFALPTYIDSLRRRVREFVTRRIIPLEADRSNYVTRLIRLRGRRDQKASRAE